MSAVVDKEFIEILKASHQSIGRWLQPVIEDAKTGQILVGRQRAIAVPNGWKEKIDVTDDLHRELIILHGDLRRDHPREETAYRLLRIACILEGRGVLRERVCAKVTELLRGVFSERYIEQLLPKEYKMKTVPCKSRNNSTFTERIEPKTALDLTVKPNMEATISFPFANCHCQKCEHKNECY